MSAEPGPIVSELHYLNLGGLLIRKNGMLAWRCPECNEEGTSKHVLKRCPKCGVPPEKSGRTSLRMPKALHASLSEEAEAEGVSLNTWIVHLLSRGSS